VSVAQLVELWIVAPAAAGSNPVAHPTTFWSQILKTSEFGFCLDETSRNTLLHQPMDSAVLI
jgi:hypothetical protein